MKVLLIDYLSPNGHLKYDKFWIKALEDLGIKYDFIGKASFIEKLNINNKISISDKYYKNIFHRNIFIREISLIKLLFKINKIIKKEEYEKIIFLSFENISMFFAYFFHKKNTLLILHNNLKYFHKKFICYIIKYLSKKTKLVSLDFNINNNLNKKNIENILIIHPQEDTQQQFNKKQNNILIFSPSINSLSKKILDEILQDKKLHTILEKKDIKLILRSKDLKTSVKNIIILNNYLPKEEYINLLKKASVIFLPYDENFNNRISGVLLEAISLNKSLIIPEYNDLKNFLKFNKKGIIGFKNIIELQEIFFKIENLLDENDYRDIQKIYSFEEMKKNILGAMK